MATIEGAAITWQLTKSDRKRTYKKKTMFKTKKEVVRIILSAYEKSAYQVNSFIVQVVFQRLLELSDHGLHKLAPEVVVPGIQEAN